MTDPFYKKFTHKSEFLSSIPPKDLIDDKLWETHYGLNICPIPRSVWIKEPLLDKINERYSILSGFVIRVFPNTLYNWHTDGTRAAGINLRLGNHNHSHTLFGHVKDTYNDVFTELNYESDTFYLFNTQHRHCVINFSEVRYVFSLQFNQTKDEISYWEIFNWCKKEGLL